MIWQLALIGLIGLFMVPILLPRWRSVTFGILVLIVYEGALRKWILPGFQAEIYLVKDLLVVLAFAGFLLEQRRGLPAAMVERSIFFLIFATVFFFSFLVLNPNSPSMLLSLLGLKNYILYFPLIFMTAKMIDTPGKLEHWLLRYFWIVLPAILISYVQFVLPPTHWINAYVAQQEGVETFTSQFQGSGLARTAGTFSYLSGNTTFLTVTFLLSTAMLLARGFAIKKNLFLYFVLVTSIGAMFTTGSRSGALTLFLGGFVIIALAVASGQLNYRLASRMIFGVAAVVMSVTFIARQQIAVLFERAQTAGDTEARFVSPFLETWEVFQSPFPIGTGLASTHGGLVNAIVGPQDGYNYYWLGNYLAEVEPARIMLESGPIGFLLIFALRFFLLAWAVKTALTVRFPLFIGLSSALAVYFAIHIVLFVVTNPPAAIYYYFGAGILIAIARMEQYRTSLARRKNRSKLTDSPKSERPPMPANGTVLTNTVR